MNILKNKKALGILGILVLGGLVFGVYYFFGKTSSKPVDNSPLIQQENIPSIAPEDIGLTLLARPDKKAIKFDIEKIGDIQSVDYEISYLAKGNIPRGAIGTVIVKPGDEKISTNYIELGSCSSGKCKYDEGVTSVKLTLRINKTDGKILQAEKTLEL